MPPPGQVQEPKDSMQEAEKETRASSAPLNNTRPPQQAAPQNQTSSATSFVQPPKKNGFIAALSGDLTTAKNDVVKTAQDVAKADTQARAVLGTNQPLITKNATTGKQTVNNAAIVRGLPVFGPAGAGVSAGSLAVKAGAESFATRFASNSALSSIYSGLSSGSKNPEKVGESAAFGFAVGGLGTSVGRLGGQLEDVLESAAAKGRLAEINSSVATVYKGEGDVVASSPKGPSLSQSFAMFLTKSKTPAPPVVGGSSTADLGNEFSRISQAGRGKEPASEIDLSLLQEIEGMPKKTPGLLETEKGPGPPERSTPSPAVREPYKGGLDFQGNGGRNVSPSTKSTPFEINDIEGREAPKNRPPAGAGYHGGGGGAAEITESQTLRYPPGTSFDVTARFRETFEGPGAKAATGGGFDFGIPSPSFRTKVPNGQSSGTRTDAFSSITRGSRRGPVTSQPTKKTQTQTVTQQPVTVVLTQPFTQPQPPPPITAQREPQQTGNPTLPESVSSSYVPFLPAFAQPPSKDVEKRRRKGGFGYREINYGVGPLFNLSTVLPTKRRKARR